MNQGHLIALTENWEQEINRMRNALRMVMTTAIMGTLTLGASAATVWHVNGNTGNDSTGDGSSGAPWATIQHAIDDAGVIDGDSIEIASGWYEENLVIDKGLTLIGGTVEPPAFAGPHPCGVHIAADNVTLQQMTIDADSGLLTGSGTLVYASRGGTPIRGLTLQSVDIDSTGRYDGDVTCLEIEQPRGMVMQGCSLNGGSGPSITHSGIHIIGGAVDGAQRNVIRGGIWSTPSADGYSLRIEPGLGESASGFDVFGGYYAFTSGNLFELIDTPLASEGISDIRFLGGVAHTSDVCLFIRGCAGDAGPGISDVLIQSFTEIGWSTSSVVVSQEGTGAPNIDFDSLAIRHCNIRENTGYAVDNQIPGTVLMAEGNFWGGPLGPNAASGEAVSAGVDYNPFLDRLIDFLQWEDITAGGTASMTAGSVTLDIDLDDGVPGHIATAFMDDLPWRSYQGMVGERGLDCSVDIIADVNPGDFIALVQVAYTDYDITNAGIDESQMAVFNYVTGTGWQVSVEGNTTGSPQWMGDSAPPALPLTPADLGKHGVDMANNIAWAVVDHFTEFTGGESNNGHTVPVELSVFNAD